MSESLDISVSDVQYKKKDISSGFILIRWFQPMHQQSYNNCVLSTEVFSLLSDGIAYDA